MIVIKFTPELLSELVGLPEHYRIEALELVNGQYVVYACDERGDADLIVEIEKPQYTWKSHAQMKLPKGV